MTNSAVLNEKSATPDLFALLAEIASLRADVAEFNKAMAEVNASIEVAVSKLEAHVEEHVAAVEAAAVEAAAVAVEAAAVAAEITGDENLRGVFSIEDAWSAIIAGIHGDEGLEYLPGDGTAIRVWQSEKDPDTFEVFNEKAVWTFDDHWRSINRPDSLDVAYVHRSILKQYLERRQPNPDKWTLCQPL